MNSLRRSFDSFSLLLDSSLKAALPRDVPLESRLLYNNSFYRWLRAPPVLFFGLVLPAVLYNSYFVHSDSSGHLKSSDPAVSQFLEAKRRLVAAREEKAKAARAAMGTTERKQETVEKEVENSLPAFVPITQNPLTSSQTAQAPEPPKENSLLRTYAFHALMCSMSLAYFFVLRRTVRTIELLPNRRLRISFLNMFRSSSREFPLDLLIPPYAAQGSQNLAVHRLSIVKPNGRGVENFWISLGLNDNRIKESSEVLMAAIMEENRLRENELKC